MTKKLATQQLTTTNDARFSYDEKTGAVRSFFGAELVGPPERLARFDRNIKRKFDAVDVGREFLETNKDKFKLENISLEARKPGEGRAVESVTFQQFHDDVPVYGAELVLGLRALDGHIMSGINNIDYEIPAEMHRQEDFLSRKQAGDVLLRILAPRFGKVVINPEQPRLFVYRHTTNPPDSQRPIDKKFMEQVELQATAKEKELYWVWKVMVDTFKPNGNWEVLLDAVRGTIVAVFDHRRYAARQAYVFRPDPITSSGCHQYTWDTDEMTLDYQRKEVTLDDLNEPDPEDPDDYVSLTGTWVKCVDLEPVTFPPPVSTGDFMFGSKQRDFLFTMTYYWTSELIKYLRDFDIQEFNDRTLTPFEIDAVGLGDGSNPENSHFVADTTGRVYISFGEGGVPDASDAHVIVHEYGHALHYFMGKRQYCYEEGFSDFLAVVWLDRFNGALCNREKVFPWDNNPSVTWAGARAVNLSARFNDTGFSNYERYKVGDILATALWTLYTSIGGNDPDLGIRKTAADTVVHLYLKMLQRVTQYATKDQLGYGLLVADQDLHGLQGTYRQQIWEAFRRRGLWTGNPPPV